MDYDDSFYSSLLNNGYKPRCIERLLQEDLEDFGAVCIEGPKYCGKTWTAQAFCASEMNLTDPSGNFQNLEIALADPKTALLGASPRLIDEWQEAPLLWDGVRNEVDRSAKQRRFILTGSSVPKPKNTRKKSAEEPMHSGVGRIERIRLRPMTLAESGDSTGAVSLAGLFDGERPSAPAPQTTLLDLAELAARGGWPALLGRPSQRAQRVARGYLRELCERDMSRIDDVTRDPEKAMRLVQSLARNSEQATKNKTMIGDMTETATEARIAPDTVTDYLQALERLFVLEEIHPWSPALRSPLRINKRAKYHLADPSLVVAALRTTAPALSRDLETFGFVFEGMCMRDLLVYAQAMDAEVRYYRDQAGLEADAIIEASDGRWAGIEIKLGHNKADEGATNLLAVRKKIVDAGGQEPAFLAVVEGLGEFAYCRPDGVLVIPIRTLTS